jgi:predicted porin
VLRSWFLSTVIGFSRLRSLTQIAHFVLTPACPIRHKSFIKLSSLCQRFVTKPRNTGHRLLNAFFHKTLEYAMQHKNALIAAAITAALAASVNAHAEVDVYGKIHTSVASVSQDTGTKTSSVEIKSNASRLGFKSSKDLENGMKISGQAEFEIDAAGDTQKSSSDLIKLRNTYVGLKGGFGEVRIGNHDTPHKLATANLDPFADTYADYNNIITVDNRLGNVVAYLNNFGPVGVAAAYYAGDDEAANENTNSATSVSINYSAGPLYLAGAIESYADTVADDLQTASVVGVGYKVGPVDLGLVYQSLAYDGSAVKDESETYVSAKFKMDDKNTLKAAYGMRDDGESATDDEVMTVVGIDHKMDKQASVYALYAAGTDGGLKNKGKLAGDASALSVGFVYKF